MTINGVGTKFYGISTPNNEGESNATLWFTFVYIPIFPLSRYIIKRPATKPVIFQYQTIGKIPFSTEDVIKTYLFGWIITPAFIFLPFLFAIKEVGEKLGYRNENAEATSFDFITGFAIIWMIIACLVWKNYDNKKGLPQA